MYFLLRWQHEVNAVYRLTGKETSTRQFPGGLTQVGGQSYEKDLSSQLSEGIRRSGRSRCNGSLRWFCLFHHHRSTCSQLRGQFDFSPRLLMFTLPFLTNTRAQVTALLQSELAQKVCAEAEGETGTVIINLCDAGGYRQFSNSKHPIKAPADLKGLKMRTNGMKTIDMTFQAMGATTTTIPYSDLYMGLKTSVADGQENPWVNVEGMKFYEVQKYFTEVNYQFHPDPFYVNAAWWNALPEEFRDAITECATAMGEYNDQLIDQNSSAAKQTIVDYGCEVYEPSADELKAFQQAVQSVYDKCISEGICTADELKEMQDIVAKA